MDEPDEKRPNVTKDVEALGKKLREELQDRIEGGDPAFKATREYLRRLSMGWGMDEDITEIAIAIDEEAPEEAERRSLPARWNVFLGLRAREDEGGFADLVGMGICLGERSRPYRNETKGSCCWIPESLQRKGRETDRKDREEWKKGEDGKKTEIEPLSELVWFEFLYWLRSTGYRHAGEWLIEEYGELDEEMGVESEVLEGRKRLGPKRPGDRVPQESPFGKEDSQLKHLQRKHLQLGHVLGDNETPGAEREDQIRQLLEVVERECSPQQKKIFSLRYLTRKEVCEELEILGQSYDKQTARIIETARKHLVPDSD